MVPNESITKNNRIAAEVMVTSKPFQRRCLRVAEKA